MAWTEMERRAAAYDFSGGNPLACRGCGSTDDLRPSPLPAEVCQEDGLLPFYCRKCGRHAQPFDRRLWSVPGTGTEGR